MFPLTAAELGSDFDLDRVLRHGSIPLVWTSDAPDVMCSKPTRAALSAGGDPRRSPGAQPAGVRALPPGGGVVQRAGHQRRRHRTPTPESPARRCRGISTSSRTRCWSTGCRPTKPRARVRERRLPKLYWVDTGVVRATKRQLGALSAEERGPLLWSPHQTRAEVDFVLRRGRELLAIEVKAASRYHTGLLAGPARARATRGPRTPLAGLHGPPLVPLRGRDRRLARTTLRVGGRRGRALAVIEFARSPSDPRPLPRQPSCSAAPVRAQGLRAGADSQRARQGARAPGPAQTGAGGASAARSSAPTV